MRRLELATPRHTLSKDVLNELLMLAHPDKWSQGRPPVSWRTEIRA